MHWDEIETMCAPALQRDPPLATLVARVRAMPEVMSLFKYMWDTHAMLRLSATVLLRALGTLQPPGRSLVVLASPRDAATDAAFDELLVRHRKWPADDAHARAMRALVSDAEVREGFRALYYTSTAAQLLARMGADLLDRQYLTA